MNTFFDSISINTIIVSLCCTSIIFMIAQQTLSAFFGDTAIWGYVKNKIILAWRRMIHARRSFFWFAKNKDGKNKPQSADKEDSRKITHTPDETSCHWPTIIKHSNFQAPFSIVAVSFNNNLCAKRMVVGFSNHCKKTLGNTYTFKYQSAEKSSFHMRKILDDITTNKQALIFALGTTATFCLKREYEEGNLDTPVVFAGVKEPLRLGIINDYQKPGNIFTGVTSTGHDYNKQLECLFAAKQTTKRILIPYSAYSPYIEDDIERIEGLAKQYGAMIGPIRYKNQKEFDKHVLGSIEKKEFDTIMTLRDILPPHLLKSLVKNAYQYETPLYSSDTPSLSYGAGIAYGHHEEIFGNAAAHKAFDILIEGHHPSKTPVTRINIQNSFCINAEAAYQQGIKHAHTLASLIQKGKILDNE